MCTCDAYKFLLKELKHLGAIKWHNNATSFYIKFKDCRIGSIRLSNHKSRKRYNYKFELINEKGNFDLIELEKLIDDIHKKVLNLKGFNHKKFIVYKDKKYTEIKEEGYRKHILKN